MNIPAAATQMPPLPPSQPLQVPAAPQAQAAPQAPPQQYSVHPSYGNGFLWRWNQAQASSGIPAGMPGTSEVPHIAQMLMREADAWRAILSLHHSAVQMARSLPEESDLVFDENREATAQRECSYLSSLSQLSAACDSIASEAIKIRGLRKAKHQMETEGVKEILRGHADEVLALGDSHARNGALTFTAITSELRTVNQALRTQIAQARALIGAVQDARTLNLPADASVVIGLRYADGRTELHTTDEMLHRLYSANGANGVGQVSEEALCAALAGAAGEEAPARARTFSRRAGCEQKLQQELVNTAHAAKAQEAASS